MRFTGFQSTVPCLSYSNLAELFPDSLRWLIKGLGSFTFLSRGTDGTPIDFLANQNANRIVGKKVPDPATFSACSVGISRSAQHCRTPRFIIVKAFLQQIK